MILSTGNTVHISTKCKKIVSFIWVKTSKSLIEWQFYSSHVTGISFVTTLWRKFPIFTDINSHNYWVAKAEFQPRSVRKSKVYVLTIGLNKFPIDFVLVFREKKHISLWALSSVCSEFFYVNQTSETGVRKPWQNSRPPKPHSPWARLSLKPYAFQKWVDVIFEHLKGLY